MRRKARSTSEELAWQFLENQGYYQVAGTTEAGEPVLRILNGVLVDDALLFHGAFAGEKSGCLGRSAVASAYEVVADIPSYFVDPLKGCPATTYYQSVQAHGTLVDVTETNDKVRMLDALMKKYQPEGGHAPFTDAMYEKDLRGVRVFGLRIDRVSGKLSLGQDRPPERTAKVVAGLFRRGAKGDCAAIERILEHSPAARPSEWRREGAWPCVLRVFPTPRAVEEHVALLQDQYWRLDSSPDRIETSIRMSNAWIGAHDEQGRLVGAARAITDVAWTAQISDVVVAASWRGRGIGSALVRLLLSHPEVRRCRYQKLGTQDAVEFYERFGFRTGAPPTSFVTHPMARVVATETDV